MSLLNLFEDKSFPSEIIIPQGEIFQAHSLYPIPNEAVLKDFLAEGHIIKNSFDMVKFIKRLRLRYKKAFVFLNSKSLVAQDLQYCIRLSNATYEFYFYNCWS